MKVGKKVGSYVVEEPIGRGGMGVVYRGRHEKLLRTVAIKSIIQRGNHDLRRLRHRFEREAYVQAQLDHPGVVKIYDYIVSEQNYCIVMEYVEGRSLAKLIAENPCGIEVQRALDLFEQILDAISFAHTFVYQEENGATHQGIIHRDLKPPNIMVTDGDRIKITDFGIVKLVGAEATDTSKISYGSPRYVSPEQAGGETLDQRSDLYSLGVILYEMLTGETPFGGRLGGEDEWPRTEILRAHRDRQPRPPSELNPAITTAIERVVLRALEKKPERRFASAADFLRALRLARGHEAEKYLTERAGASVRHSSARGTDAIGDTTGDIQRDTYNTQPIAPQACPSCKAETLSSDFVCRQCGDNLTSSPATSELARLELTSRQDRRSMKLVGVSSLLLLLLASLVFLVKHESATHSEAVGGDPTPVSSPTSSNVARPTDELNPSRGTVSALQADVSVDSSFDGYSTKPLTDGVTDVRQIKAMRYNQGNWVSAERPEPHWIEFDFKRPARVTAVYIFWGFDRDRFMPSRHVDLQAADGDSWRTVATLEPGEDFDRAAFEFEPFVAARLRVSQPEQAGPAKRPFVMWVREVQAFGVYVSDATPGEQR